MHDLRLPLTNHFHKDDLQYSRVEWMAQLTWGIVFVTEVVGQWGVFVCACLCVCADTEEAWQTCPLSADGGMHNSIWRQFHAVSLPVSSLFPETDKSGFGYGGRTGAISLQHSLAQQLFAVSTYNNMTVVFSNAWPQAFTSPGLELLKNVIFE